MLISENAKIRAMALHKVGNKSQEEGLKLSAEPLRTDAAVETLLLQYFLSPFKSEEYYNLNHESDLQHNEVYRCVAAIFDDSESLYECSVQLAEHLYNQSSHPKIKSGELYVVHLEHCVLDGEEVDAVGLFKSESKEPFLKVYPTQDSFTIDYEDGINIHRLDKGCLVLNTERENGFVVMVVDNLRQSGEAMYWRDDFLNLTTRRDIYHQTEQCLDLCKQFVTERLPEEFKSDKVEQADMLNKSVQFFKENESFSLDDFAEQVIQQPEVIDSFKEYKNEYESERGITIDNEFDISDSAVKKQARVFKSVIKLDKNFHVYVHGNRELIERGYDDGRAMRFYKLYFNEEK